MGLSKIRIGVYGASASGKTSFFRQLVQRNDIPAAPGSKLSQFMILSIGPDGQVLPTTVSIGNVDLRIDGCCFQIGDWNGETLAEGVDRLDLERRKGRSTNPIARQIARCDAFFFFFDPTAQRDPEQAIRHFQRELLRAKQLIDGVLESRQNRLLPILFILTHRDSQRSTSEFAGQTQRWIDEVAEHLEEGYARLLSAYFPRPLTRKENLFHSVSCVRPEQGENPLRVLEKARSLVELAQRFRRQDRKRARRLVLFFFLCGLFFLFVPILCLTSPVGRQFLSRIRAGAAPVLDRFPALSASLSGDRSEHEIDLTPLSEEKTSLDEKTAASLNRSLFFLMKRLNKLEDADQENSEEYRSRVRDWTGAFDALERRFDSEIDGTPREKQKLFAILLATLADSPARSTGSLNELLKKYWERVRQCLAEDLHKEVAIQRDANSPPARILDELCRRLEKAFREVSESRVRGDRVLNEENESNRKERLKQDIRKVFIACRNYADRYPVEIKIRSASYESDREIDRDYDRRLLFNGGREKGDVFVDLTISSGFQNDTSCTFLPGRKDLTVFFALDHPLLFVLQQKKKGSGGEWEKVAAWEFNSESSGAASLESLGVRFYLRFENNENVSYFPEGKGYRFDLAIHRPRSVPEFLWEIVSAPTSDEPPPVADQ